MQYEQEYEIMALALDEAKTKILAVDNKDLSPLKMKIRMILDKEINSLTALAKKPIVGDMERSKRNEPRPLKSFMGKPIVRKDIPVVPYQKQTPFSLSELQKTSTMSAQEAQLQEVIQKRDELYTQFLTIESDRIKDQYEEIVIRGVAKRAGLPVSEIDPKIIDIKFIDQIKDAIKIKNNLEIANKKITPEDLSQL